MFTTVYSVMSWLFSSRQLLQRARQVSMLRAFLSPCHDKALTTDASNYSHFFSIVFIFNCMSIRDSWRSGYNVWFKTLRLRVRFPLMHLNFWTALYVAWGLTNLSSGVKLMLFFFQFRVFACCKEFLPFLCFCLLKKTMKNLFALLSALNWI